MRKIILILAILTTVSTLKASDCITCEGRSIWQTDSLIESYSPCNMKIIYKYRECITPSNDTLREMKLESVEFFGDCAYADDEEMVVNLATRFILSQAYRVFPSLDGQSINTDVTFRMECCWEYDDFANMAYPCSGGDCECCAVFDLRRREDANGHEYHTYPYEISNNSPSSTVAGCGQGCEFVCEALDQIPQGIGLKPDDNIPCKEDCADSTMWYQSSYNVMNKAVPGTTTCSLSVYYQYRECDDFVEFKFNSFEYIGNDCDDDELLWNEAIEGVLAEVASYYTLPMEFKFNFSTCWKRDSTIFPPKSSIFAPCVFDNCCEASYVVTDISGNPEIRSGDYQLDTLNSFISCGTDPECIFVCDDDYAELPYNHTLSKEALIINGNIFETSSEVVPNPTNGKTEFFVSSRYSGEVSFNIMDNTGKVIFSTKGTIKNGKTKFEYNTKELSSGVYFYNVKAGLHNVDSGKFIKQ